MNEEPKETNVVQMPNSGMPALTPEMIEMMAKDSGRQKFNIRELMVPVLKIANTTSDVMKRSSGEYVEGIQEGDFVDTLTRVPMKPPIELIIARFETNYIESKPDMGPTVKLWGTDPTGYQRAISPKNMDVGTRITENGNEIREVGSYFGLLLKPDRTTLPCVWYMGSTAWKEARRLNALLASVEVEGPNGPYVAPPFAFIYKAITVPDSNDRNTWMTWKFTRGPWTLSQGPRGQFLYGRAREVEEAVDKRLTRIHGTADDERFAEKQAQARQEQQRSAPPRDDVPPPTGEADYGGKTAPQTRAEKEAEIIEQAKDAPF